MLWFCYIVFFKGKVSEGKVPRGSWSPVDYLIFPSPRLGQRLQQSLIFFSIENFNSIKYAAPNDKEIPKFIPNRIFN
jgi:hypothetical protein